MLPLSGEVIATRLARLWIPLLLAATPSCAESEPDAPLERPRPETAWVEIGGELFELELALDAPHRFLGMGHRRTVPRNGGMLFVFPDERPLSFVMRDCPIALDVAFLDRSGRILAIHEMQPEPPRRGGEAPRDYEQRLPGYASVLPARFAIETAGGRLAQVGAAVGQSVVFDAATLSHRAR